MNEEVHHGYVMTYIMNMSRRISRPRYSIKDELKSDTVKLDLNRVFIIGFKVSKSSVFFKTQDRYTSNQII